MRAPPVAFLLAIMLLGVSLSGCLDYVESQKRVERSVTPPAAEGTGSGTDPLDGGPAADNATPSTDSERAMHPGVFVSADPEVVDPDTPVTFHIYVYNPHNFTLYYDAGGCGPFRLTMSMNPLGPGYREGPHYHTCTMDYRLTALEPGANFTLQRVWDARLFETGGNDLHGRVAPAGEYRFVFADDFAPRDPSGGDVPRHEYVTFYANVSVRVRGGDDHVVSDPYIPDDPRQPVDVAYTLTPDRATLVRGTPMTFEVTLENRGNGTVYYDDGPRDCGSRSVTLYNLTHGKYRLSLPTPCPPVVRESYPALAPGDTATWGFTWDGQAYDHLTGTMVDLPAGGWEVSAHELISSGGPGHAAYERHREPRSMMVVIVLVDS